MDENRIAGAAKNVGGQAQESFGRVTGNAKIESEGIINEVSGAARDQVSDLADVTTKKAQHTASSFEKALRTNIENQPYTAVVIALGLGWLFGRMHRPL
jgi:uncharacterized protein YjbJ (UPF0337 family)